METSEGERLTTPIKVIPAGYKYHGISKRN